MPAANTLLHDKLFPLTPSEQSVSLSVKLLVTGRSLEDLQYKTSSTKTSVDNYWIFLRLSNFPIKCISILFGNGGILQFME